MNISIDKIVNEWSYHVGIIDKSDPLHIIELRKILNRHKLEESIIDQYVSNLLGEKHEKELITEAAFKIPSKLEEKLNDAGKLDTFNTFYGNLPSGKPLTAVENFIKNKLKNGNTKKQDEFVSILGSAGTSPKVSTAFTSGLQKELFNLEPKGVGKGEIWLAVIVKGSSIQGGEKSYDLDADKKYEVKDYSASKSQRGAIRAGVEASVSRFPFWQQILSTVADITKIEAKNGWDLIPSDIPERNNIIALKKYILDRVAAGKIVGGEFNLKDTASFIDFYTAIGVTLTTKSSEFNQVVFRGPNQKPLSYSIEPMSAGKLGVGSKITIKLEDASADLGVMINFLKRLKYVRSPKSFFSDITAAVDKIVAGGPAKAWIIFRPGGTMKIVKAAGSNFEYKGISQGGIKFAENV